MAKLDLIWQCCCCPHLHHDYQGIFPKSLKGKCPTEQLLTLDSTLLLWVQNHFQELPEKNVTVIMTKKATNVMYSFLAHFTPPPKKNTCTFCKCSRDIWRVIINEWKKPSCTMYNAHYKEATIWCLMIDTVPLEED